MSTEAIDDFILNLEEPQKSTFLFLRDFFKNHPEGFEEHWKWKLPSYSYKNKIFCYLWMDKKTKIPYIGFSKSNQIEHPLLDKGNRKIYKVFHVNPEEDIDLESLEEIIKLLTPLH